MSLREDAGDQRVTARWTQVSRLVDLALELDRTAWPALLERHCSGDPELRTDVERLLQSIVHAETGFLTQGAAADASPLLSWVARQGLPEGTRFAAYEIIEPLGRGGMATVYLAHDHKHHRRVAVKVLHPEVAAAVGREWFLREIEIAAALHHPHILPLHDSGAIEESLYYVMPYVDGESLRQRLNRDGTLTLASAGRLIQEVAGALDYAHRQGVVHRDIKPENILLQDGQAIVADFGIARAIATGVAESGTADTIPAVGTPAYMSPEQAAGHSPLDGRTDVYALGCVLYEMLEGRPAFAGPTAQAIIARHTSEPAPMLGHHPDLPETVGAAIERALQKRPDDRFATAGEFVQAVEGSATVPAPFIPSSQSRRRHLFLGVAAFALLALLLGLVRMRQPSEADSVNPKLVAILPFRVAKAADAEFGWLREGMADLLAVKLSGEGGVRAVESRSVLSAWRRVVGPEVKDVGPATAFEIARRVGAGRVIDGSVLGTPRHLTLSATMLTGSGDRSAARASVEGPVDSLSSLVDRLAASLLSLDAGTEAARLSSLTSSSLPAVRAYLAGRAAFRKGQFRDAFNNLRDATLLDSTFALAALELLRAAKWLAPEGADAKRARRLALAGRERLAPGDRALLDVWVEAYRTMPELIRPWKAATVAYPERADLWYGLGDAYYHYGMLVGLENPMKLAADAFEHGWALDSAGGADGVAAERSAAFAEPLGHMVEIALAEGDTGSELRFVALGLAADSTSAEGWYLRWHRAVALGDSARRAFWADSQQMNPEVFELIHRFTASAGVAAEDYFRSASLMLRHKEVGDLNGADFGRHLMALNSGRPLEAARILAGKPDVPGFGGSVGLLVREALYWGGDTSVAAAAARRLVPYAAGPTPPGKPGWTHLQSICTLATWRLAHGDHHYAEVAVRRLRQSPVLGLEPFDSIAMIHYKTKCAALLEAIRTSELRLPQARATLEAADAAARAYEVGQSLGANLIVARLAEAQGDLPRALRAVRRRANAYGLEHPWYLSTFLREEGRLAALVGDTAGAVRAYRHYLAMRPNPEPTVAPEVERVRAELADLTGS